MRATIFIDGEQGTTGLQLRERLQAREDVTLVSLEGSNRKDVRARAAAIDASDLAVLCLPDAAAREVVAAVRNPAARILDASSAHRTEPGWVYGLPEMCAEQAARIAGARRVSNPGCYPTGAIALLRPLVAAGCLDPAAAVSIFAVSGYSGRGRAGIEAHEAAAACEAAGGARPGEALAFQIYGLSLAHKHVPEIQRHAGLAGRPLFVPSYGDYRQGIALTVPVHRAMTARKAGVDDLRECLQGRYAASTRVRVLDRAASGALERLDPQALNGSDDMELAVLGESGGGDCLLAAVFDNLGKGAAGAAVQNVELMLGLASRPAGSARIAPPVSPALAP